MEIHFLNFLFINFTLVILFVGSLVKLIEPYLPVFLSQTFRYGKFAHEGSLSRFAGRFECPKSWFAHFYVFALGWSSLGLFFVLRTFLGYPESNTAPPNFLISFLDLLAGGGQRPVQVDLTSATVAMSLLTMQCVRRFYETNFIQIFSSGKMNLSHYLVGFLHYFGAVLAIMANAEGFTGGDQPQELGSFNKIKVIFVLIFLWAWYQQYMTNLILISLRQNNTGSEKLKHYIPKGGYFEYVSSPHFFFEIVMYIALWGIMLASSTWLCIVAWVCTNQTLMAMFTHQWYKSKFENYPVTRKVLIPGVF